MKTNTRCAELGKIHVIAKRLGMDPGDPDPQSDYRAMLWTVARVRSARDLDESGRRKVLDHLARVSGAPAPRSTPSADRRPLANKLRAQLAAGGYNNAYADAMARRMYHVARHEWCNPEQLRGLVAALEYNARRKRAKTTEAK